MAPTSTLSFNCALITGGGSGLGRAMAESLIQMGKSVILVGRSESKLKETAKEIGAKAYYVLDTGDIPSIPAFVAKVIKDHPDVDCVINNAGVQRPFQILGPDYDFDPTKADEEININIRGPLHLCLAFVPHFNKNPTGAVIMNVSSILGFLPFSVINPVYNGTKAWLHMFSMNLRTQLSTAGSKIKIVEIVPPSVETDLHRDRKDPDDNKRAKGAKSAMTVEEFMQDVEAGWKDDLDTVAAGSAKDMVKKWFDSYGADYEALTAAK